MTHSVERPCPFKKFSLPPCRYQSPFFPARGHGIGEGLQGFTRAVLAGGVPCLLAPKWNIPVEESTVLMMRVYAFMAMNKVREKRLGDEHDRAECQLVYIDCLR